jgi:hypothetical protein
LYAEDLRSNEQQITPAIVYNIARYVTWPTSALTSSNGFVIGLYGHGRSLFSWSSLFGKYLHGHNVRIIRTTDMDELLNCQVVYIESFERKNMLKILAALKESPVLTISEIEGFSRSGGMIALRNISNRMVFEVNLKSARTSGLSISSNILKLAVDVIQ